MKFKKFVNFADGNDLTKMRHVKPQIDSYQDFITDLHSNQIDSTIRWMNAADLIPTQKNYNLEKVRKFYLDQNLRHQFPVTVSNDDYVIDGHHRWAASLQHDEQIKVHVIDETFRTMDTFLRHKPYCSLKGVND